MKTARIFALGVLVGVVLALGGIYWLANGMGV